ncbi:NAD(P)/FAD-dependent oxidoreductase [Yoonia litorea]|uniref:Glycine/D-amino acid oxidase n=1 Tax=Yoonia litorea TaxID=1123755 RepID=A0A1I6MH16_9RHOB|nr:FAD-dependent oxidoreductase [Yoonia litorea]SFS14942.1 Glycine/D-amino acid oxidase [Yoonia litorea]
MAQRIIVVGAGIIGAGIAMRLARAGADVTVIAGQAPLATTASFGWINASFFLDDDHHRLRAEGIAAWHRLTDEDAIDLQWSGCLCWDLPVPDLEKLADQLGELSYPVEWQSPQAIASKEPALRAVPEVALHFPVEGAAPSADMPNRLLAVAEAAGAKVIRGLQVNRVLQADDGRSGVETAQGVLWADQVVLATGTGTQALAGSIGARVPMLHRPAYNMRTKPVTPILRHILASPIGEIRQEPSGHILMPAAAHHQADSSDQLTEMPNEAADAAMVRLREFLNGIEDLDWSEIMYGERPVPADGKPVIGSLAENVYVACLHSGITLGPIVAELAAQEIAGRLDNAGAALLAPYRPDRFAQ